MSGNLPYRAFNPFDLKMNGRFTQGGATRVGVWIAAAVTEACTATLREQSVQNERLLSRIAVPEQTKGLQCVRMIIAIYEMAFRL